MSTNRLDRAIDRLFHLLIRPITSRLSLALRVAVLTTLAVAVTLGAVSSVVYFTVRSSFESSLDESMVRRAEAAVDANYITFLTNGQNIPAQALALADVQVGVLRGGELFSPPGSIGIAQFRSYHEIAVSIGQQEVSARTVRVDGEAFRVVAVQAGRGTALVLAQPMDSVRRGLDRLRFALLVTSTAGLVLAGAVGWAVATNGLRPVRRLTSAAERVARTQDLTPIRVVGKDDELARLTRSFNAMLLALDASQARQRQLVADAGHELRTPLTSLRTNIELLGQASSTERNLTEEQRAEIMDDVRAQLLELTTLVGDLVELARDEPVHRTPEPLDLVDVVEQAVERVRLRAHDVEFDVETQTWMVFGESQLLERAVTNLLDNAAKWSPSGGTVTVRLADGVLTVADEGPGIAPEDLPRVFDRFYRASEARTLPGSGLGLSIVSRAIERHGGTVSVASEPGHGATFTMTLPGTPEP